MARFVVVPGEGAGRRGRDRFYRTRELPYVDGEMRAFLARQEAAFFTTIIDGYPPEPGVRTGPLGFVRPWDDKRLAWPEPQRPAWVPAEIELLFVDLFRDVSRLAVRGAADWEDGYVVVHVAEARLNCAKPLPRLLRSPSH